MRKELILAIAAGSFLGLVIAFGIWRANIALSPRKDTPNPTTSPIPSSDFKITLAKPKNNQVITETPTIISGITKQDSYVIVSAEDSDYVTKANNSSQFEAEVELTGGVNQIEVVAFDGMGTSVRTNLLVVYSSEFAKDENTPLDTSGATTSANTNEASSDAVRQKVQEKLDQVESNPIATLGTITDITDTTIQIKTQNGEIQLVSLDKENATFVKIKGDTSREVKFTDLAIGDFIVALGFKNGNGILHAKRILITDPLKEAVREVVYGQVLETDKLSELSLKGLRDGKIYKVEPETQIKITDLVNAKGPATRFGHIDQGDTIIAVGTSDKGVFTARTIILVKNAPTPQPSGKPNATPKS